MLVLSRKAEESVVIGDGIVVKVLAVQGGRVRLGISAPDSVSIVRKELLSGIETQRSLPFAKQHADTSVSNQFSAS